jgi:hypothetical protein
MGKNSAHALDRGLVEVSEEVKFDWPGFLPVERIKAGIREIAVGLIVFCGARRLLLLTLISSHKERTSFMSYPYSSLYLEGQWSKLKLAQLFHSEPGALGCELSPWSADRVPASSEHRDCRQAVEAS